MTRKHNVPETRLVSFFREGDAYSVGFLRNN
jgi:hypothetical protein